MEMLNESKFRHCFRTFAVFYKAHEGNLFVHNPPQWKSTARFLENLSATFSFSARFRPQISLKMHRLGKKFISLALMNPQSRKSARYSQTSEAAHT
jgi:hypothetical protein